MVISKAQLAIQFMSPLKGTGVGIQRDQELNLIMEAWPNENFIPVATEMKNHCMLSHIK